MLQQTIIWTALPRRASAGPLAPGSKLRLSVFVSPRLFTDDKTVEKLSLSDFPDFLDWPQTVAKTQFQVEFKGNFAFTLDAEAETASRSDLWKALFKPTTKVVPYSFDNLGPGGEGGTVFQTFPAGEIDDFLRDIYRRVGSNPDYGAGGELPSTEQLARDPGIRAIGRPFHPEQPQEPPRRRDVRPPGYVPPRRKPPRTEPEPKGCGCLGRGCAGCLGWPLAVLARLLRRLGLPVPFDKRLAQRMAEGATAAAAPSVGAASSAGAPLGPATAAALPHADDSTDAAEVQPQGSSATAEAIGRRAGAAAKHSVLSADAGEFGNGPVSFSNGPVSSADLQAKAAFDQLADYVKPLEDAPTHLPDIEPEQLYDFHEMVSLLGDYPVLLRELGLVVDLTVTVGEDFPPGEGTFRVVPVFSPQLQRTTLFTPQTHYTLAGQRFFASPRPTDTEISGGLLRLNDTELFRVVLEDIAGGGIKLQNAASNVVAKTDNPKGQPPNVPAQEGLPTLRTAGVSVIRPGLAHELSLLAINATKINSVLEGFEKQLPPVVEPPGEDEPPPGPLPPPPLPPVELFAEDLVRGYRVDVFDDRSKKWHSLCRRTGTYSFLDAPDEPGGQIVLKGVRDEGFVQTGATEQLKPPPPPDGVKPPRVLRVHESLFTWDGWSLCAPRPGKSLLEEKPGEPESGYTENKAVTAFKLETKFEAVPKSLPRLRFGYNYRVRARVVDLAGNSVLDPNSEDPEDQAAFQQDVAERTPDFKFTRFEPVNPPALFFRTPPLQGESLERMVVRSHFKGAPTEVEFGAASERHVVPPKAAQFLAEQHGMFDGQSVVNPDPSKTVVKGDPETYDLASREAGTLTERLVVVNVPTDPPTKNLSLLTVGGLTNATDPDNPSQVLKGVLLQTNEQFELTYLPDPFARGVLLRGLPGVSPADKVFDPSVEVVNKIPFGQGFPDRLPLRVRLVGVEEGQKPSKPKWDGDPKRRVLVVELPQAEIVTVRFSSYLSEKDLEKMGVWQWLSDPAPPGLDELKAKAAEGANWQHMPWRELTLVHAVRQPLKIPRLKKLDPAQRQVGDTSVRLSGEVEVHPKSTGKVDLHAEWSDPVDDLAKPTFDEEKDQRRHHAHLAELLAERGKGVVAFDDITQSFGDTKHHVVTYTPVATTSFREYFPAALTADAANLTRPTPDESKGAGPEVEAAKKKDVHIPNTARPDAPKVLYVVPTFGWEQKPPVAGQVVRTRRGGGLRVYLERPWFSSGRGELLGVVCLPGVPFGALGEELRPFVTQWGHDPIWQSKPATGVAEKSSFVNAANADDGLSLEELPGVTVSAAGYEVEFDPARGLWYSDIELSAGDSYFPFVRLALARFQPHSVAGAHLSRVVRAEFAQTVPDRTASYVVKTVGGKTEVTVTVSGATFTSSSAQIKEFEVGFERREAGVPGDLGWTRAKSHVEAKPVSGDTLWQCTAALDETFKAGRFRVFVREYEHFRTDFLFEDADKGVSTERRIVYADSLVLE